MLVVRNRRSGKSTSMDFGRIEDKNFLDSLLKPGKVKLPANDPRISLASPKKPVQIFIGPPVWSHPGWVGTLYPKKTKAADFLKFFSRQFNAIELNSSFYRTPTEKTILEWKSATPPTFRFSPKVNQAISRGKSTPELLREFCEQMKPLGDRLGLSFMQLPPNFSRNQLPSLKTLLKGVPKNFALAVEFRHPSWFDEGRLSQDTFEFLSAENISTVITDALGRPDVLHSSITTSRVMVRFLASEMHPSDFKRTDLWVKKIGTWIDLGVQEIYFFPHLHGYDRVPELSSDLITKLNKAYSLDLKDWTPTNAQGDEEQPRLL
jgi:uncharacterized protein YecE (DUF72 family)